VRSSVIATPTSGANAVKLSLPGFDPAIHLLLKKLLRRWMDARIKSGHDEIRRHGQLLAKFKIGIWRNGRCPSLLVKRSA
jgi:hypothetical protein